MTVTLITGANKGIGFATARQLLDLGHIVYVGARDKRKGEEAAAASGARFLHLDVTDDASVTEALSTIDAGHGRLDVLVNNAGVAEDGTVDGPTALRVFDTNVVGIIRVTEAALPLLRRSANPTVVTVSSSAGSFWATNNPDRPEFDLGFPLYSASKAAATMITLKYARSQPGIKFNAVEPGFTATDMTAALGGGRSPAESARIVVRLATLPTDGPTGTLQDEFGHLNW
ncbi:SDR family NAD(P)-dependent oxidoreductase [Micromonospora chalcea]|uniref:SDR family NAD(P)-dependent oxidoreductase n=1 Tax=Micromonospora chalcea TaxID=1874 RepID=UPI002379E202|nr:SDR family NAD(P)-dependent oxidoreductase [Micromonospora chalcea]WDP98946.1 SDR family NAD(P)-dependent oxidoreductase [Micromonospora chalcea]